MEAATLLAVEAAAMAYSDDSFDYRFLAQLTEAHGTSGFEENVQALFRERVRSYCDSVTTDVMGNVFAVQNQGGHPRVLLDCHSDEIGFMVRHIDEKGFLYVTESGGWDPEVMVSQRVMIHSANGPVHGVFGKKAIHLMSPKEAKQKAETHTLWIDIGARDRAHALEQVRAGDPVSMDAKFQALSGGRAVAKAFDNRAGMFCVSETLRRLGQCAAARYAVSTVQEEVGFRGAKTAAYSVDADVAICLDVTHAFDIPKADLRRGNDIKLGAGPVIPRGPNTNNKLFQRIMEVADRENIMVQVDAAGTPGGVNAAVTQLARSGTAAALIALPLRYMHNPCEMISLSDIENTVRLLVALIESLTPEDNWIPGTEK